MSDYVRKKCVRFKIPQNIIDKLKNEDEWLEDLLLKEYNVKENFNTVNNFVINSGLNNKNNEYEYFLDYQLDYEYGAGGDFESVRLLTDNEFKKYSRMFAKYFSEIGRDELRLVDYGYYNGVDEPSVYELEEIMEEKTADEMLEELGFSKIIDTDTEIKYYYIDTIMGDKAEHVIQIAKVGKIVFSYRNDKNHQAMGLGEKELQAIYKKYQELGWIK